MALPLTITVWLPGPDAAVSVRVPLYETPPAGNVTTPVAEVVNCCAPDAVDTVTKSGDPPLPPARLMSAGAEPTCDMPATVAYDPCPEPPHPTRIEVSGPLSMPLPVSPVTVTVPPPGVKVPQLTDPAIEVIASTVPLWVPAAVTSVSDEENCAPRAAPNDVTPGPAKSRSVYAVPDPEARRTLMNPARIAKKTPTDGSAAFSNAKISRPDSDGSSQVTK